jgi:hypothetical protein
MGLAEGPISTVQEHPSGEEAYGSYARPRVEAVYCWPR